MAVSGTFASPEKQGLIIDKSRLWNLNGASQGTVNRSYKKPVK